MNENRKLIIKKIYSKVYLLFLVNKYHDNNKLINLRKKMLKIF